MSEDDGKAAGSARRDPEYLNKLIAAVARREDRAFEQVFTQLTDPVYRLALAVVRDPIKPDHDLVRILTTGLP